MDHTRQYAHGGPTTEHNLAAACAHDHDLRDNGWQVIQTSPGHVTWISRTGHRYPAEPPPIIESMPEPFAPNGWTFGTFPRSGMRPMDASGISKRGTADDAEADGNSRVARTDDTDRGAKPRGADGHVGGNGGGLAAHGYGAGSITGSGDDELPFLPTWTYEPAWWEEHVASPNVSTGEGDDSLHGGLSGASPHPADDVPPF